MGHWKKGTSKLDDQFPKNWASLGTFSPQGGLPSLSLLESVESGCPKRCRKVNHHWFRRMLPFYIFLRGAVMQLRSEGVWSSLHSAAQKSANSLVQHRCFWALHPLNRPCFCGYCVQKDASSVWITFPVQKKGSQRTILPSISQTKSEPFQIWPNYVVIHQPEMNSATWGYLPIINGIHGAPKAITH